VATWLVLGAIVGSALAFGDTGHLPAGLVPIVLALAGAAGGFGGGLIFALLNSRLRRVVSLRSPHRFALGALAGVLSGLGLYLAGLGVVLPYCLGGGAVAGTLSAVAAERTQVRLRRH
jgi:hypothetical protein